MLLVREVVANPPYPLLLFQASASETTVDGSFVLGSVRFLSLRDATNRGSGRVNATGACVARGSKF
jgi:hypothetical protein